LREAARPKELAVAAVYQFVPGKQSTYLGLVPIGEYFVVLPNCFKEELRVGKTIFSFSSYEV